MSKFGTPNLARIATNSALMVYYGAKFKDRIRLLVDKRHFWISFGGTC